MIHRYEDVANEAVSAGTAELTEGRGGEPLARTPKGSKDFLTAVDLASERAIRDILSRRTPDIGFFGEEEGGDDPSQGRVWVTDPVDGTINYAVGAPLCGTMLALLEDGEPVLGVIDLPFLGVRYQAAKGEGAWCGGRRLATPDVGGIEEAIIATGDAFHHGGERGVAYMRMVGDVQAAALRLRCFGAAAVVWSWLASGYLQGCAFAHNNVYDVSAGKLLVREAGAVVCDYDGSPHTIASAGAVAGVPGVIGELTALTAPVGAAAAAGP